MREAQLRLTQPDSGSCHDVGLVPRGGLDRGYMRHDFFYTKGKLKSKWRSKVWDVIKSRKSGSSVGLVDS